MGGHVRIRGGDGERSERTVYPTPANLERATLRRGLEQLQTAQDRMDGDEWQPRRSSPDIYEQCRRRGMGKPMATFTTLLFASAVAGCTDLDDAPYTAALADGAAQDEPAQNPAQDDRDQAIEPKYYPAKVVKAHIRGDGDGKCQEERDPDIRGYDKWCAVGAYVDGVLREGAPQKGCYEVLLIQNENGPGSPWKRGELAEVVVDGSVYNDLRGGAPQLDDFMVVKAADDDKRQPDKGYEWAKQHCGVQ